MPLYHYSEEPDIARFVPRPPLARPEVEPLVWAIDAWHSPVYTLPRDCPRVCFWPLPTTTADDYDRWFVHVAGRIVVAVESRWLPHVRACVLHRYRFADGEPFAPMVPPGDAGYHGVHVSREAVTPLAVEPVGDLLDALAAAGAELRVTPSLVPLGEAVVRTSLHWSLMRMRNARGWKVGA